MCKSANTDFIDKGKNFNLDIHLNNNKLHLNNRGSYKLNNALVNYVSNVYKWYDLMSPLWIWIAMI